MKNRPFIRSSKPDASSSNAGAPNTHFLGDTGKLLNERGNRATGIDGRRPLRHARRPYFDNADLRDPIAAERAAHRFHIDEDDGLGQKEEVGKGIGLHA